VKKEQKSGDIGKLREAALQERPFVKDAVGRKNKGRKEGSGGGPHDTEPASNCSGGAAKGGVKTKKPV